MLTRFNSYLNNGPLTEEVVATSGKDTYVMPARRNAGHIAIPLVREIVAPTVFRNAEVEITDIEDRKNIRRVRATPNKFKFGERGRGLLVLRALGAGGRLPQNRTAIGKRSPIKEAFDLNTLVFGDSALDGNKVLPVKAAVQYSDGLSTRPYFDCVGESFHHRGDESGTLWDAESKKNTDNLFTQHFIIPGTLLVQVLTSNGRQLPPVGLNHLFLSLGLAGSYGGRTSVTGTNVRTHVAGIFASRFERPISSPYELLRVLPDSITSVDTLTSEIERIMAGKYIVHASSSEATRHQRDLIEAFEQDAPELKKQYHAEAVRVAELFEKHFS